MSKIILAENASDPDTPSTGKSIIFFREDGILYAKDDLGVVTQVTNADGTITVEDEDSAVTNTPHSILNFTGAGVTATDAGSGQVNISIPGGGGSALPRFAFAADQMDNPNNADWAVDSLAPAVADTNNNGLTIRLFDDTTEEGIGFEFLIPSGATNLVIKFVSRAETTPPAARTVGLTLYQRGLPDNAAVDAWSAGLALTDIDIPTNENFQYDSQTIPLATLGVVAGELTQFELTRINPVGGVELVGDWALKQIRVEFT